MNTLERKIARLEYEVARDQARVALARQALRTQFQRRLTSPKILAGSFILGWFAAVLHRPSRRRGARPARSIREQVGPMLRLAPLALRFWMSQRH